MPGIISSVFQPEEGQSDSTQTTTLSGGTDTGIEASPSVGIGLSGSYEDADGTTQEWSNETQVGADIDLDAAVGFTASLTDGGSSDFSA